MLSADPIINSIYNTQAYNRFSYVWNNPLKFVDPMGYDGAPPVTNVPVGQGLSGGISSVTGWQYGNSGSPCTCSTMPNTPVLNIDRNSSSSGIMDAHYRLVLMGTAMSALSSHLNSYIHHTNGYGSTYGLGLAGFGYNQTPVSSGGISSSSSPWDYALAMGPPGEGGMEVPPLQFGPPRMPGFVKKFVPYAPDAAGTVGGASAYKIGVQLDKPLMRYTSTAMSTPAWGRYGYNTLLSVHASRFLRLQNLSTGLKYFGIAGAFYSYGSGFNNLIKGVEEENIGMMIEAGLDLTMTRLSFWPGYGLIIGGVYFLVAKPIYNYYFKP